MGSEMVRKHPCKPVRSDARYQALIILTLIQRLPVGTSGIKKDEVVKLAVLNKIEKEAAEEIIKCLIDEGAVVEHPLGSGDLRVVPKIVVEDSNGNIEPLSKQRPPKEDTSQVLSTLIQSQDSVTWLAFSLAMTTEVLLLTAAAQLMFTEIRQLVLGGVGALVALAFLLLVSRSNQDMANLVRRASIDYQEAIDFPMSLRSQPPSATKIMAASLRLWIAGWAFWVLIWAINVYLKNPYKL